MISFIDDTPLKVHISTIERITMTYDKHSVSLDDARRILAAGEAKARAIGQPMNLAVVDAGGNLVAHIRMDDAWIGSIDISINKAFTARAFNLSTKSLAEDAQPGGQFYGIHASNGGRIMIFAGGIPLQRDEQIVGAIGVSGGSGEQDQAVAEAAVAAF
ncbi:heme-binding protein [Nostoc sp. S13]|uniref:GlcG/HbpS family heme-binding protein n=2 Tax=unclassified Nostoc TaxID=2593658 RepID=UPI0026052F99|nr:heme-binding protein [Nostoc sp. S13]MDF5736323.1 heme-binding protein [Nostoc sp. S13]